MEFIINNKPIEYKIPNGFYETVLFKDQMRQLSRFRAVIINKLDQDKNLKKKMVCVQQPFQLSIPRKLAAHTFVEYYIGIPHRAKSTYNIWEASQGMIRDFRTSGLNIWDYLPVVVESPFTPRSQLHRALAPTPGCSNVVFYVNINGLSLENKSQFLE